MLVSFLLLHFFLRSRCACAQLRYLHLVCDIIYLRTLFSFHFTHRHVATLVSGNVTVEGDSILTFPTKNLPTVHMQLDTLLHSHAIRQIQCSMKC